MNVMKDTKNNAFPLLQVGAMVEKGTWLYVYLDAVVDPYDDCVFIKQIARPKDVLDLCTKVSEKLKHHPRVYNMRPRIANGHVILELNCI